MIGSDFKGVCPVCRGKVKLVWTSEDGKTKGYKCVGGHRVGRERKYPIYLVG